MKTPASLSVTKFARTGIVAAALSLLATAPAFAAGGGNSGSSAAVGFGGTAIPGGPQSTSYVIGSSGSYYLAGERVMTASVPAIVVNAPDVTIDLNGATIRYTSTGASNGIQVTNCSNVEIRNGTINDVPGHGISATDGSDLRVRNVRITSCTGTGIDGTNLSNATLQDLHITYCGNRGIYIFLGDSVRVLDSLVSHNSSGVVLAGITHGEIARCTATYNAHTGVVTNSPGGRIIDNLVAHNNTSKTNDSGIFAGERNFVRGNTVDSNYVTGIFVMNQCVVEGNTITSTFTANGSVGGDPIRYYFGLSSGAIYVNNRITAGTAIDPNIINAGGNIFF